MAAPRVGIVLTPTGLAADALCQDEKVPPLSLEQNVVLGRIMGGFGESLLVQGFAGCGKSAILRTVISKLDKVVIQTLDRFCASRAGDTASEWLLSVRTNTDLDLSSIDLVILDEMSMISALRWNKLSSLLRRFKNPDKPFGGLRVVMFGDVCQLPPVLDLSLFGTAAYNKLNPRVMCLAEVHRYDSSDVHDWTVFTQILKELSLLFYDPKPLSSSVAADFDYLLCEPARCRPNPHTSLYLYAQNEAKDNHNRQTAKASGVFNQVILVPSTDSLDNPLETGAVLFESAPVVVCNNVYADKQIVVANGADCIFVRCVGTPALVFETDSVEYTVYQAGPEVQLQVQTRSDEVKTLPALSVTPEPTDDADVKRKRRKKQDYSWPIVPGFARTIHNVQGMTHRGRMHIDLTGVRLGDDFPPQLLYVALSRVRHFRQVSLSGIDSGIISAVAKRMQASDTVMCPHIKQIAETASRTALEPGGSFPPSHP